MEGFPEGFKISPVDEKKAEMLKMFKGHLGSASVEVSPRGWVLSAAYEKFYKDIKQYEFLDTDVMVHSYPKSGTTWLQEILWTMVNNPNQDHPMKDYPLSIRSPTLELDVTIAHAPPPTAFIESFKTQFPERNESLPFFLQVCDATPHRRIIKTHFSFDLFSHTAVTRAKVCYIIRDPRDTCISFYHYAKLFLHEGFEGTLDDFINVFLGDAHRHGTYWANVSEAWKRRDHPNVHVMFYEKLKKNTSEELRLLDKFLGTNLTVDQLEKVEHFTSFAEMKKRDDHVCPKDDCPKYLNMELAKKEGGFFRKGESGGWKNVLNQEQKDRFEAWIEENCPDPKIMETISNP